MIKIVVDLLGADIGGFVTCGATGVVLISSILILGKLNATRPALSVVLNGRNDKPFCIVDCGANIDCKADRFVDFARLGVAYMKTLGIENPTVATLSNGIEAGKGSDVIKEAHELLEKCGFNFTGNIEGKEVLDGNADVVVCDGFAGNVLLKSIEGTAKVVFDDIRRAAADASDTQKVQLEALIGRLEPKFDYNNEGGAILLGVKRHGAATDKTVYNTVKIAYGLAKNNLVEKISEEFEKK